MSNDSVGQFLGDNFEATHQKVGTFQIIRGVKVGGNVASYFCLDDGTVVHAVAGPVDARTFLQEAKWAVEVHKLALTDAGKDMTKYRAVLRKAHLERLAGEREVIPPPNALPRLTVTPPTPTDNPLRTRTGMRLGKQGQVDLLLANYPLPKLSEFYPIVFTSILGEKTSTLPVKVN